MSPLGTPLVDELRAAVRSKSALLIAGAGIAIAATERSPTASWTGLLRSGAQRCRDVRRDLSDSWLTEVEDAIQSGDVENLIAAAQRIEDALRKTPGNQYRKWLRQTVGSLEATSPGVLQAIADLEIPVATTNYDELLQAFVGGSPATWVDPAAIQRIVRQDDAGVIHIHGHWKHEDSVVLGMDSYNRVLGDARSQEILRALFASHSVIFAGFGAGLDDPNFLGIRRWAREMLHGSDYPPTLLVRDAEWSNAAAAFEPDGFQVVSYGPEYEDLEIFLADLRGPRFSEAAKPVNYTWDYIVPKLDRLFRRIRREFTPDIVISASGPGSIAPHRCLAIDPNETPVLNAVTFPRLMGRSTRNIWFTGLAEQCGWHHIESRKWDVFVPNILSHLPAESNVLIFDDRVIGGNVQRMLSKWLKQQGHEVRRAALVVHPDAASEVHWYEDVIEGEFQFPWGGPRGRA